MNRDQAMARLRELWRADPGGRSFELWLKAHGLVSLAVTEADRQRQLAMVRAGP